MKTMLRMFVVLTLLLGVGSLAMADRVIEYNEGLAPESVDDVSKYYRVRNTDEAATSFVNGDVVIWDLRSATNTSNDNRWSVTTTTVAAHPLVAGVMTDSVSPGQYGYLQVSGIHSAVRTTGMVEPNSQGLETSATRGRARGTVAPKHGLGKPFSRVGSGDSTVFADIDTK